MEYLAVKLVRSSVEPLIEIEVESPGGCLDSEVPDLGPPSKIRTKHDKPSKIAGRLGSGFDRVLRICFLGANF